MQCCRFLQTLGHTKIESTVRDLGVDEEEAFRPDARRRNDEIEPGGVAESDFESLKGAAHRRSTDHERFFSYVPISSLRASTCLVDAAYNCALPSRGESGRTTSRAHS